MLLNNYKHCFLSLSSHNLTTFERGVLSNGGEPFIVDDFSASDVSNLQNIDRTHSNGQTLAQDLMLPLQQQQHHHMG